jgi:hypothetical protein
MSTQTLTAADRTGAFLLSEAPGSLSRETVTLVSGQDLDAGAVLGKLTKRQAAAAIPSNAGTGSGAMTALTFGPDVQVGDYVITLLATSATSAFTVVAPDGTSLPNGAVGTAYSSSHLSFLISDGGTMTAADTYTVAVTAGGTPVLVGTGTGVVSAFSLGKDAQLGAYRVQLLATSATAELEVIAPDGSKLKRGQVATAYASSHINFSLSNAGTMTSGDYFIFIVANHTGQVEAWDPTAVDGTQDAYGVLYGAVDASTAATAGAAIVRDAEVSSDLLQYAATVTSAQKLTAARQLADRGIYVRS